MTFALRYFPLEACEPSAPKSKHGHLGIHQQTDGKLYLGVLTPVGRISVQFTPAHEAATRTNAFFRAVSLEHLFDGLGLSLQGVGKGGAGPYESHLTVTNAQTNHILVLQASEDLRHWTSLATNTPVAVTNWLFLDTNAPSFDRIDRTHK